MIRLEQASIVRKGRALVAAVSLALEPGRVTVVVGPNGAGKSTLLRLCSGQLRPTFGTATLDAMPLDRYSPPALAARRAVLAQDSDAAFGFTIRELVGLGLRTLAVTLRPADQARLVEVALDQTGLTAIQYRPTPFLSGGERQRAHLARVLVQLAAGTMLHGPGTLLLDEPIAAQDLAHQLQVMELVGRHAQSGGAVLCVLHDLNWAARTADHLMVLQDGGIYAEGLATEVITRRMLAEVFEVELDPGGPPVLDRPFVLPQLASLSNKNRSSPERKN